MRASTTVVSLLTATALPALAVLVPTLYGEAYRAAAPAVLALGCIGAIGVASGPVSAFVLARLSARTFLVTNVVALAVNVTLAMILIPGMGLWGAVIANGAGTIVRVSLLTRAECRALGLTLGSALGALLPLIPGVGASAAAWRVVAALPWHAVVEAFLAAVTALSLVLAGVRLTRSGLGAGDSDAILRNLPGRARPSARRMLRLLSGDPGARLASLTS